MGLEGQAASLSEAFSYQGRLDYQGSPATGTYDLTFSLFSNATERGRSMRMSCLHRRLIAPVSALAPSAWSV
jgi:hypothetical protein